MAKYCTTHLLTSSGVRHSNPRLLSWTLTYWMTIGETAPYCKTLPHRGYLPSHKPGTQKRILNYSSIPISIIGYADAVCSLPSPYIQKVSPSVTTSTIIHLDLNITSPIYFHNIVIHPSFTHRKLTQAPHNLVLLKHGYISPPFLLNPLRRPIR